MKRKLHPNGFSLVELMIGMVAAAILVLTAGAMLWHAQAALRKLNAVVNVHRDMRASMDVLTKMTRPGTNFTYVSGTGYTVMYSNRAPSRVYASGSNLLYRVNTSTGGDQQLANGTLLQFNVVLQTNKAIVTLVLGSSLEQMSNRVVVTRRN